MKISNRCPWHFLFRQVKLFGVISLVAFANAWPLPANAAIMSGNASFDSNTGLYTYNYILDNSSGPAAIKELSILFDRNQNEVSDPPYSSAAPTGWSFGEAVSGTSADSPLNEFGAFWQWYASQALDMGGTMNGFSFTTPFAPVTDSDNNYFLWSNSYTGGPPSIGGGGIVEWGHIVAPNFGATVVLPVPATLWLFGSGLLGLIGVARRKRYTQ
jgi:hypothetical protein